MKTFVYIAKDSGGSEVRGKVKAENLDQASVQQLSASSKVKRPMRMNVFK